MLKVAIQTFYIVLFGLLSQLLAWSFFAFTAGYGLSWSANKLLPLFDQTFTIDYYQGVAMILLVGILMTCLRRTP